MGYGKMSTPQMDAIDLILYTVNLPPMKRKNIQIAVLDDHQSVIDALKVQLAHPAHLKIDITATNPGDLLYQMNQTPVDMVLADDTMLYMNEDELTKRFKALFPQLKIVALMASKQNDIINKMIQERKIAGAVLKNSDQRTLVTTLESIADNTYFRDKVLQKMPKVRLPKKESTNVHLTDRELEIIRLIEQEYSNKQIAQKLVISERTVETHRKNIFRKTKTNSVIGLIKYAWEHKLV
jgi:DNA-binding NarL/FixJ family response regulator